MVHVSADFQNILEQFPLAGLYPGIQTVQGVVYDTANTPSTADDSLWISDQAGQKIRHLSLGGAAIAGDISLSYAPNGLAFVEATGRVYINDVGSDTLELRSLADGSLVSSHTVAVSDKDHLFYEQSSGKLYYSFGANGSNGRVGIYDTGGGTVTLERTLTFYGADAIEGIVKQGSSLFMLNDAYFHNGNPALNRALAYPL